MKNYKIAVAGTGYVGLSLSVLLAQHNQVTAVDIVQAKVDMINNHRSPIQDDYIEKYLAEKELNLTATLDAKSAYTKFKLHFYKQIFSRFEDREATLTTVESFCMEVIMALGEPTIAQFSHMMNLSTPNAAYKINSLVKKGYVERIRSTTDKREYRLRPTQKYIDYYNISYSYLHLVMERAKQRFSPDDLAKLEEMLQVVSDELMPEIQLPK